MVKLRHRKQSKKLQVIEIEGKACTKTGRLKIHQSRAQGNQRTKCKGKEFTSALNENQTPCSTTRTFLDQTKRCRAGEVYLNDDVLQESIPLDRVVDLRLVLATQVDSLRVAAALKVEDPVFIPSWYTATHGE